MNQAEKRDRTNLRLNTETRTAVDNACTQRPGRISRNTWIIEAILEKLSRDGTAIEQQIVEKHANG